MRGWAALPLYLDLPDLDNEGMDFLFSHAEPVAGSIIDVLQIGDYDSTRYGKFSVTRDDFSEYIKEFQESNAAGRRQVDFDHKGSQGDTRAAGWIQDLHVDGDKLKARVEWTPAGKAAVEGKEYRFTSAEYQTKVRNKNTGDETPQKRLKAVTLTNRPFIDTMDPVSLSDDPSARIAISDEADDASGDNKLSTGTIGGTKIAKLPKASYAWVDGSGVGHLPYKDSSGKIDASHTQNALARLNQVKGMSDSDRSTAKGKLEAALRSAGGHPSGDTNNDTRKNMSEIHTLLGLSEEATDEQMLSAVKVLVEKPKEPAEDTVTLAEFTKLAEDLVALKKSNSELLRDTYLSEQVRLGRITPAEMKDGEQSPLVVLFDANPTAAKAMIEARPVNKMLSEIGGTEGPAEQSGDAVKPGDIWDNKKLSDGRSKLDARARQLMTDKVTDDYGEALVLAEREALNG